MTLTFKIYQTLGDKYCLNFKKDLDEENIPYTIVNVSETKVVPNPKKGGMMESINTVDHSKWNEFMNAKKLQRRILGPNVPFVVCLDKPNKFIIPTIDQVKKFIKNN